MKDGKDGKDVRFNVNRICVFQIIFCFASEKIVAVALFFLNGKNCSFFFCTFVLGKKCVGVTRSETG